MPLDPRKAPRDPEPRRCALDVPALFADRPLDQDALGFPNRRQPVRDGLFMTRSRLRRSCGWRLAFAKRSSCPQTIDLEVKRELDGRVLSVTLGEFQTQGTPHR